MSQSQSFAQKYGPWALVAGASEGLGAAFAEQLAARGLNLLLLARRAELLAELGQELQRRHHVEVRTAAVDLARPDLLEVIRPLLDGIEVGLLVYNAAYAVIGPLLTQPLADQLRCIDVNCRAPLILAHEVGQQLLARRRGGIILMSSVAATQGSALIAAYGATKAFNLNLAEALWDELRASGIDVLACRAGSTRTPNFLRSEPAEQFMVQPPEEVAQAALAALGHGPSVVPGLGNRLSCFVLGTLMPRRSAVTILGTATRRLFGHRFGEK